MVDDGGEPGAGRDLLEGLGEGRTVAHRVEARIDTGVEDGEVTDRGGACRPVDERLLDGVGAEESGVDVGVGARRRRRIQRVDEVSGRYPVVVLDLDESDDVSVEAQQGGDNLGPLAAELGGRVGAAAVQRATWTAAGSGAVGGRRVDRREVVEDIEARDLQSPAHLRGGCRPRVRRLEDVVLTGDRTQLPGAEGVFEHAGQPGDGVTAAEGVTGGQAGGRVVVRLVVERTARRVVLVVAVVVEDDPASRKVGEVGLVAGFTRRVVVGVLVGPLAGGQHDLAEAGEIEVLADRERRRDGRAHALDALERRGVAGRRGGGQRDDGNRRQRQPGVDHSDGAGGRVDLRVVEEFGHDTGDLDEVTRRERPWAVGAAEDEDAFGGVRVGVSIGVLLLEQEAVQDVCGGDEGGDNGLHVDGVAHEGRACAVTLDVAEQRHRVRVAHHDLDRAGRRLRRVVIGGERGDHGVCAVRGRLSDAQGCRTGCADRRRSSEVVEGDARHGRGRDLAGGDPAVRIARRDGRRASRTTDDGEARLAVGQRLGRTARCDEDLSVVRGAGRRGHRTGPSEVAVGAAHPGQLQRLTGNF